jgi:vacuolar-type H+-ATPase subunit C/Vma6
LILARLGAEILQAKYAFISAYLKGAEAKVITQENVTKMLRASSFQDVLAGMANTDIGNYFDQTPAHTFGEVDRHLWRYLGTRISQLENLRFIPDDILKVLRAYVVKYDVINIKSAALQVFTGTKAKLVALGLINKNGLLKELANADNFGQVVDILYKCDLRDYATVLEGWKKEESKPEVVLSAELYSIYYKNFLSLTKGVKDSHVLMKAIGSIIDLTNLEIVSRAIIEDIGMEAADSIIADGYLLPMSNIKEMLSLKLSNLPEKVASAQY